ncbi:type II toxin-antitoxin system RelE/ParE family toxin [Candidatus Saccharibacteria bacterium]|nr:MAG: type II toxin-antitoxin system RelE/ParE family toxin [Candidatus Saccharibacteria bacterium]
MRRGLRGRFVVGRYRIVFAGSSKKDIAKLDQVTRQRIARKLQYFLEQDDPLSYARQLVHSAIGSYRFRVGHYRIVFDIDDDTIQVVSVKHRGEVYRK